MSFLKAIQKRVYDILSHRQSVILCFLGFVLISVSTLHFGEILVEWSKEKYHAVFNSFNDNIVEKGFQNQLCQHVPIDVVYTWVNGSDPELIRKLYQTKRNLAKQLNITKITSPSHCTYSHCVESNLVLVQPVIPFSITLDDLEASNSILSNVSRVFRIGSAKENQTYNYSVFAFDTLLMAKEALEKAAFTLFDVNYTMNSAFLTDDWMSLNGILLKDTFIMTGIPAMSETLDQETLYKLLPDKVFDKVFFYEEKSLAVLSLKNSKDHSKVSSMNVTIYNKTCKFSPAYLVVEPLAEIEDVSASRFADNEELRYSLRSLSKNAPWIRKVFLVTNGQIPYWLNLDNPRLTIVTHDELFTNKSDLPTFSSPAIECHLHKIIGLSEKFLYLNDDTFFGKQIWPEDFYTHSNGFKVYLSWPVPDCAEGCPTTWIKDGYCDRPCNNSDCEWDGGDCNGNAIRYSYPQAVAGSFEARNINFKMEKLYCNPSCAHTWLSDRYCDQACNVLNCGFDAGDCGTEMYSQMTGYQMNKETNSLYSFPKGEYVGFLNLTDLLEEFGEIVSGSYETKQAIRTLAVSLKFKVLTLVLQQNCGKVNFSANIKTENKQFSFDIEFDTTSNSDEENSKNRMLGKNVNGTTTVKPILIISVSPEKRFPKIIDLEKANFFDYANLNLTASKLSSNLSLSSSFELNQQVLKLTEALKLGYLTERGYKRQKSILIDKYLQDLKFKNSEGNSVKNPILIYNQFDETLKILSDYNKNIIIPNNNDDAASNDNVTLRNDESKFSTLRKLKEVLMENGNSLSWRKGGFLPWEKQNTFKEFQNFQFDNLFLSSSSLKDEEEDTEEEEKSLKGKVGQRRLLDTFGDSLRHVNKLYNGAFGYEARKVPAHMAHLVDVGVMNRLQKRFPEAFAATSSHKIRSPSDMQFAFSYDYFLMSETKEIPIEEIFDQFDTDFSGSLSDREIRTLLTRISPLPLQYSLVNQFEENLINCSKHLTKNVDEFNLDPTSPQPPDERYYGSNLPMVTKWLLINCQTIAGLLIENFGKVKKNKFEIVGEEEITFKMLHSNFSKVLTHLDEIRKNPKKFICLNDNIGHGSKDSEIMKAVLRDFFESQFPVSSSFELSGEYRNRFLHVDQLRQWQRYRDTIRISTYLLLAFLLVVALASFCASEVCPKRRLIFKPKGRINFWRQKEIAPV